MHSDAYKDIIAHVERRYLYNRYMCRTESKTEGDQLSDLDEKAKEQIQQCAMQQATCIHKENHRDQEDVKPEPLMDKERAERQQDV